MTIGVVTVFYNSERHVDCWATSVLQQKDVDLVVIAVDNKSSDSTVEVLERWSNRDRRISVVKSASNVGIAAGNNVGADVAIRQGCDALMFLNPDVKCPPETFIRLSEALRPGTAVSSVIVRPDGAVWYAGGRLDVGRVRGTHLVDFAHGESDYAPTCCWMSYVSDWCAVGRFDERLFLYYDDYEYMCRWKSAGLRLVVSDSAQVVHEVGGSSGGSMSAVSVKWSTSGRIVAATATLNVLQLARFMVWFSAARAARVIEWTIARRLDLVAAMLSGFAHGMSRASTKAPVSAQGG